ncbi:MAG TPA: FUSC family protein [Gemmataceae bacterium]|nr:FUSC family protein [Gemmataceae bacterium]
MDTPTAHSALGMALREALAAVVCLVLAEWWHLEYANLAVWTTYMVTVQYPFTAFQKGVERILGRGLGILVGWVILTLFHNAPVLALTMKLVALLVFFYVYFSGRLAYTFINAGFYLAGIVSIGVADPSAAFPQGKAFFWAVLLGVVVADLVMWLTGSESDLRIQAGGEPLLPMNYANLNHSLMLVVTVALTQLVTSYLDLPTTAVLTALLVLTITPDVHAMLKKNELRIFGAVLGTAWGIGSLLLLIQLSHFPLQAALLFLGIFLAAYLARASRTYSLAGVQMGLVLPLALVMPLRESASIHAGLQRLEGIVTALVMLVLVASIWASFGRRTAADAGGSHAAQR